MGEYMGGRDGRGVSIGMEGREERVKSRKGT